MKRNKLTIISIIISFIFILYLWTLPISLGNPIQLKNEQGDQELINQFSVNGYYQFPAERKIKNDDSLFVGFTKEDNKFTNENNEFRNPGKFQQKIDEIYLQYPFTERPPLTNANQLRPSLLYKIYYDNHLYDYQFIYVLPEEQTYHLIEYSSPFEVVQAIEDEQSFSILLSSDKNIKQIKIDKATQEITESDEKQLPDYLAYPIGIGMDTFINSDSSQYYLIAPLDRSASVSNTLNFLYLINSDNLDFQKIEYNPDLAIRIIKDQIYGINYESARHIIEKYDHESQKFKTYQTMQEDEWISFVEGYIYSVTHSSNQIITLKILDIESMDALYQGDFILPKGYQWGYLNLN